MSDIPDEAARSAVPREFTMPRLFLLAAVVAAGCAQSQPTPAPKPEDPKIRIKETISGDIGPAGGSRTREYEGPASQAPDWAKPKPSGVK